MLTKPMPVGVAEVRRELCSLCPTPCTKQKEEAFQRDPCSVCPMVPRRWGQYGRCANFSEPRQTLGLGDAVAKVAQPIARVIDRVAGTNIQGCGGCKQRQSALNALVPDLGKILAPDREKP